MVVGPVVEAEATAAARASPASVPTRPSRGAFKAASSHSRGEVLQSFFTLPKSYEFNEQSTLAPCRQYTRQRTDPNGTVTASCTVEIVCGAVRVLNALDAATVNTALMNGTLFGRDTRPSDGQVLHVTARGGSLDIGVCDQTSPCPAEIRELYDALLELDAERRCSL